MQPVIHVSLAGNAYALEEEGHQALRAYLDGAGEPPGPRSYGAQVAAGVMLPVLALASAAISVGWLIASAQLVVGGRTLGWTPNLPLWDGLLHLGFILVLGVLAWELVPEVRQVLLDLPGVLEKVRASLPARG